MDMIVKFASARLSTPQIVWGRSIHGWFIFGDLPGLATIIGSALIIAVGIYVYRTQ
jgi:hypothetical protein